MAPTVFRALSVAAILSASIVGSYAGPTLADDASRISTLESTVQQLRIRIDELNRRIEHLEAALSSRASEPLIKPTPGNPDSYAPQAATGKQPWHAPESWTRVTKGMTQAQVTEILGTPTAIESMDAFTTLFYRAGPLTGLVNLREDRVVAVKAPSFPK